MSKQITFFAVFIVIILFISGCKEEPKTNSTKHGWHTDYQQALKTAKEQNKKLLVDFSGSDWCGWCIKLEEEVFSQKEFIEYADKNLVLVFIDFPKKEKLPADIAEQNQSLAKQFGIRGFPTVILLDGDGNEIARTGYQQGGPKAYVKHLQELIGK